MAYKALQIAQLLLSKAAEGNQELMSNLKLQKMLYYEQGFHLAAFDTPLFDENIEAWMFGPVVPEVYEKYAKYDAKGIEPPTQIDIKLNEEETTLFNNVFDVYNQYSAVKLVEMTHKFKIIPPIQGVASVSRTAVSSNDVLFSFKYLVEESYKKCCNSKFFTDLLGRFKKYSTIGWQGIRASGRFAHSPFKRGQSRFSRITGTTSISHFLHRSKLRRY